jgi:hypothetical protein
LFNTALTSGLPTGTVGAGAASLALSTTSTNPIAGAYSLQVAAGTAWTAGQGVISSAFTVDRADLGKVLTFKLYYEAASGGANANWSGVLGSQTLAVYLYDVNAAAWVQPAGFLGMNQNSGAGYVTGTFQTSVTSGQLYQLAIIALQATTLPLTLTLDQVSVGPQTAPIGPVITDWVSYTPTISWGTGCTASGKWRRVGDSMELDIAVNITATLSGTTQLTVSGPAGFSFDTSKWSNPTQTGDAVYSIGSITRASTTEFQVVATPASFTSPISFTIRPIFTNTGANPVTVVASTGITQTYPITWQNTDSMHILIKSIPVAGWSSTTQMSNDTDTRVVALLARNPASSSTSDPTGTTAVKVTNLVADFDTHGAWNSSTQTYTIPVSGYYDITSSVYTGAFTGGVNVGIILNSSYNEIGSFTQTAASAQTYVANRSFNLKAGDTVSLGTYQTSGSTQTYGTFNPTGLKIQRLSGPSVIAATETVAAFGQTIAGLSIPNAVWTTVTTPTIVDSTHGALTTGGVFTAPVSGRYIICASVFYATNATGSRGVRIRKNTFDTGMGTFGTAGSSAGTGATVSGYLKLNAGDTVTMETFQNTGVAISLSTSPDAGSVLSIVRVGN